MIEEMPALVPAISVSAEGELKFAREYQHVADYDRNRVDHDNRWRESGNYRYGVL